jgi:uncharacterized protein (DUF488 family)
MPQAKRRSLPTASVRRQIANRASWNESRPAARADFFTIGYSGRKLEEIIAVLQQHAVRTLVDIRRNPISVHRPEMSQGNLAIRLEENGMRYAHAPQLGVPRDIRAKATAAGSRDVIWAWYDESVIAAHPDLRALLNGFEHSVALMCTELDPHECHRHCLALALEGMGLKSFDL